MHQDFTRKLTYSSWDGMKGRCLNPKTNGFDRYGGKGITICNRWLHSFEDFIADMGYRPSKNHSIDRYPNRNGNYEPGNCRWATREEQRANMANTIVVEYKGENIPLFILAHKHNISPKLLYKRVIDGKWDITTALLTPKQSTIKWGRFCSKIQYINSDSIYNTLRHLLIFHNIPLAKSTTNGLSKSVLYISTAKYRTPDRIYAGMSNPSSKLIEGVNTITNERKIFHGLSEAAKYVNGAKSNISNVISGTAKSYKKWTFKHFQDR